LRVSAKIGLCELQKSGTTTIMDMGTLRHQEVIFEEMINSGMRGFAGKCMVDQNELYPAFCESTGESLNRSIEFAKAFHNSANGRIKYGFAPRFVLSCSEKLLKSTFDVLSDFEGALFHTHSSENKQEIAAIKKKTGYENIEYFNKIGVLSDKTVLAHCIHLNEKEKNLLKETSTSVAHCPSSNLKLGSGIADIPDYIKRGIKVSIGADGAPCNNNLSTLTEMRLASLIQKPIHGPTIMDARTILKLATIDGARALGIENETGSIEVGKKADLILIDLNRIQNSLSDGIENIYSDIVYSADGSNIREVMIDGKWVAKNSESVIFDEQEIINLGKKELKKIIII
jgi:5-methylthioadenosine/S-adenosylhomocysteine deaminase